MAKVYDLTEMLEEPKSTIKLGTDEYEIDNGFVTALELNDLSNKKDQMDDVEFVKQFLTTALGNEQYKKIIAKRYSTKVMLKVVESIADAMSEGDEETPSKRGDVVLIH